MLQTCDVRCCVKKEERHDPLMLDVANIIINITDVEF
jgi:hypothetical protein